MIFRTVKRIAAELVVGVVLMSGCADFHACRDAWWGTDKAKHFAAAAMIGAGGAALVSPHCDVEQACAVGFSAAMLAGTGKEWSDLNVRHTCWSWRDLFWDSLGASVGASTAWAFE